MQCWYAELNFWQKHQTSSMGDNNDEAGYNVGNLQDLEQRFKCTYCGLLLRDPVQGDCGHRYCTVCVKTKHSKALAANEKPMCSACDSDDMYEISPDRSYPDTAIKREITKKLHLLCPYSPCDERMQLTKLEDHLQECKYRPVECPQCGDQSVPSCALEQHKSDECPQRLVACKKCNKLVAMATMQQHQQTVCIGNTRQCEYCLERVRDTDAEMEQHLLNSCSVGWHAKNQCPYGCAAMPDGWQEHRRSHCALHIDRLSDEMKRLGKRQSAESSEDNGSSSQQQQQQQQQPAKTSVPVQHDNTIAPDIYRELEERISQLSRNYDGEAGKGQLQLGSMKDEDEKFVEKFVEKLDTALRESKDLRENLMPKVNDMFQHFKDKLKEYKDKCHRDLVKKLEIEQKCQELLKLLAYKEVKIVELERRIDILENSSYDGVLIWKITDVQRRKAEAREGKVCSIYSPPFYTGKAGYKMCGRLYLNGDGTGKNTHISLFFVIMRSQFDALLPWPFAKKVSMMLLDQNLEEHVIDAFKPDTSSSSFRRPTSDMNIASGCPQFMPINDFENSSKGYVKEDTIFIKFIVDKSDLPA